MLHAHQCRSVVGASAMRDPALGTHEKLGLGVPLCLTRRHARSCAEIHPGFLTMKTVCAIMMRIRWSSLAWIIGRTVVLSSVSYTDLPTRVADRACAELRDQFALLAPSQCLVSGAKTLIGTTLPWTFGSCCTANMIGYNHDVSSTYCYAGPIQLEYLRTRQIRAITRAIVPKAQDK